MIIGLRWLLLESDCIGGKNKSRSYFYAIL
jgi:hypothetical protein